MVREEELACLKVVSDVRMERLKKTRRIVGFQAEIRSGHLPYTCQVVPAEPVIWVAFGFKCYFCLDVHEVCNEISVKH